MSDHNLTDLVAGLRALLLVTPETMPECKGYDATLDANGLDHCHADASCSLCQVPNPRWAQVQAGLEAATVACPCIEAYLERGWGDAGCANCHASGVHGNHCYACHGTGRVAIDPSRWPPQHAAAFEEAVWRAAAEALGVNVYETHGFVLKDAVMQAIGGHDD